jgi:hypothetical protein
MIKHFKKSSQISLVLFGSFFSSWAVAADDSVIPTTTEISHLIQEALNDNNPACLRLNLGPWLASDKGERNIQVAEYFAEQKLLIAQYFTASFNQKDLALMRYIPSNQGQPYFQETDEGFYNFCYGRPEVFKIDNIEFTNEDDRLRIHYRYYLTAIPEWLDNKNIIRLLERLQNDNHFDQLLHSSHHPLQESAEIYHTAQGWQVDNDIGNDFVDDDNDQ